MYYKIKKEELKSIFPLENIDLDVNKLIIKKYVEEGNIFINEKDNIKTQQEKKIAYLIINHDEICVNLIAENEVNNPIHLQSALMTDSELITIKITDQKLQEKFKEQFKVEEIKFRENNNLNINEDFLLGLTQDGWDNKEFILKKIASFKDEYNNDSGKLLSVELFSYIPDNQWLDEDFIQQFFKDSNINKIVEYAIQKEKNKTWNVLYNEKILEGIIELQKKELLNKYISNYSEIESKNSYGNSSIAKDRNNNSSIELINKEKNFMKFFSKYFKDVDHAKKIIKMVDEQYFYLFDMQLRKNKEFKEEYITLALISLNKKVSGYNSGIYDFSNLLGVDSFTDKRVQEFAIKHGNKIYGSEHQPLIAAEIIKNSKEEIAEIISKGSGIDFLWDYLSKEQKQEKIIVKEMLKQNPKIYNKLIEELRLDKEIFQSYYTQLKEKELLKDFKVGKISKEFFESFNEEEIIHLITVVPDFLLEEKFPSKYFENMKVMAHSNINYHVFMELLNKNEVAQNTFSKIFKNKELSLNMLERQGNVFELLNDEVKMDMEILEKYVKNSYHYENLPPKVFLNKNLLLHIVRAKPNFVEKIPEQFFKEQDFLLRIFEKIDNKELSLQILTSLPTVINEVLNTTPLKIGDYYKFFSNAFSNMNLSEKLETGKKENIKKTKI